MLFLAPCVLVVWNVDVQYPTCQFFLEFFFFWIVPEILGEMFHSIMLNRRSVTPKRVLHASAGDNEMFAYLTILIFIYFLFSPNSFLVKNTLT